MHYTVAVYLNPNEDLDSKLWPYFEQMTPDDDGGGYLEHSYLHHNDDDCTVANSLEELEGILLQEHGITDETFDHKRYGFHNPNSQWDWWTLGGRWANKLMLTNGEKTDIALMQDIAIKKMCETNQETFQNLYVNANKLLGDIECPKTRKKVWNMAALENPKKLGHFKEIDLDQFMFYDEKDWIQMKYYQGVGTHSILGLDQQWHESDNDPLSWSEYCYNTIAMAPKDALIAMVDCHI
jgi:hypothetical protein